jgi:hypothetical protein
MIHNLYPIIETTTLSLQATYPNKFLVLQKIYFSANVESKCFTRK